MEIKILSPEEVEFKEKDVLEEYDRYGFQSRTA